MINPLKLLFTFIKTGADLKKRRFGNELKSIPQGAYSKFRAKFR